jgi:hypothetical protein
MRRAVLGLGVVAVLFAVPAAAQSDVGPKAGTWGGEACFNYCGAFLMRFRDPNSAWLFGITAGYAQEHLDESGPTFPGFSDDSKSFNSDMQFGMRYYRATQDRARPFLGLGAIVGVTGGGSTHAFRYGATSDMGTSYFFTPHLSLGVAGGVSLVAQTDRSNQGGNVAKRRAFFARFDGFRVLGAVYF